MGYPVLWKYPARFAQHFIDKSLKNHERRDHHSFNDKPKATASTDLFDGKVANRE